MAARRIPLVDPRVAVRPGASTTLRRAQSSGVGRSDPGLVGPGLGDLMSLIGLVDPPMAADAVTFGGWDWSGSFTTIDLIAATHERPQRGAAGPEARPLQELHRRRDPPDGAARRSRRRDHPRRPRSARFRPRSRTLPTSRSALGFGVVGYLLAYDEGQLFREGLFQFMTSFSLPLVCDRRRPEGRRRRPAGHRLRAAGGGRPDGGPVLHRPHERRDAEAIHPWRVVRHGRRAHGPRLGPCHVGRRRPVGGGRDLVRDRLHPSA